MNIGIDLGTTSALIATVNPHNAPYVLSIVTPTCVCLSAEGAFVGDLAEALSTQQRVIRDFKRHFGEAQPIGTDARGQGWSPEAIAALVLKKLIAEAKAAEAAEVTSAVIAVPAYFNERQRQAVRTAAALAGIPGPLRLIKEPEAAALYYRYESRHEAQHHDTEQALVVYDLSGETFHVTLLALSRKKVQILHSEDVPNMGGKTFDARLADIILAQFEQALGHKPDCGQEQLHHVAERLKRELSERDVVQRLVLLGEEAAEVQLTRHEFEDVVLKDIEQTEAVTLRCLKSQNLKPQDVQAVLLVGGSAKIPLIHKHLHLLFNQPGQRVLANKALEAVALGAALCAHQPSDEADVYEIPPILRGVTEYHVGIRAIDPCTGQITIDPLLKQEEPLPAYGGKIYYTPPWRQDRMLFDIVRYVDTPSNAVSLGQLDLDLSPSPQPASPIKVEVEYREDGTVAVRARDLQTGREFVQPFGQNNQAGLAHLARQRALVLSTSVNGMR